MLTRRRMHPTPAKNSTVTLPTAPACASLPRASSVLPPMLPVVTASPRYSARRLRYLLAQNHLKRGDPRCGRIVDASAFWTAQDLGSASETEVLRRFQAPSLLALLAKDPQLLAKPVRQQAAILFVDLSGFTGLTESLGPAWTRDLLVELHERIERAATAHHGFVVSYMGDGAMIVFGLPAPQPLDAACALAAIEQLHRDLSAWLGNLPPVALGKLSPRVGGHFGPVVLSRLGTADHQHIAATGDTVNVASRLLEVSKQHKTLIAVSEDLYRAAALPGTAAEHGLGEAIEIEIRGRAHPMSVRLGGMDAGRA